MGGDAASEGMAGSPVPGGASAYPELRPTCAGDFRVNLYVFFS